MSHEAAIAAEEEFMTAPVFFCENFMSWKAKHKKYSLGA